MAVRPLRVLPLLVACVLPCAFVAACGDDGNSTTSASMPTPATPKPGKGSATTNEGMHDGMQQAMGSHSVTAAADRHPEGTGHRSELADLDFAAQTLSGQTITSEQLHGHAAVLWFWAPGCADCVRLAPAVMSAFEKSPQVQFVGVAGLGTRAAIEKAAQQMHTDKIANLIDSRGALWRAFGVTAQPAFAFITADGEIEVHKGSISAVDLEAMVAKLA